MSKFNIMLAKGVSWMRESFMEMIDLWKKSTGVTSNKELAKMLEVPYPTFASWLRRQSIPKLSMLKLQKKLPSMVQDRALLDLDPMKKNRVETISEILHSVSLSTSFSIINDVVNAAVIVDVLYSIMCEIDMPSSEYIEHNGIYSETYFNFFNPIFKYITCYVDNNRNSVNQNDFYKFFMRDEFTETLSKMLTYHYETDSQSASKRRVFKILKKLDDIPQLSAKYWLYNDNSNQTIQLFWSILNQTLIKKEQSQYIEESDEVVQNVAAEQNCKIDCNETNLTNDIGKILLQIANLG